MGAVYPYLLHTKLIYSVQPTSLTVIASCGANGNTYPVGPTGGSRNTISGNATQVVWNPWQWEQPAGATPFAEATYVLKIWDDRGEQATIRAGYLSPYSGTQFSLSRPGKATPLYGMISPSPSACRLTTMQQGTKIC